MVLVQYQYITPLHTLFYHIPLPDLDTLSQWIEGRFTPQYSEVGSTQSLYAPIKAQPPSSQHVSSAVESWVSTHLRKRLATMQLLGKTIQLLIIEYES